MTTYIDTQPNDASGDPGHSWVEHCARRLEQSYGPERATAIADGRDAATESDLAAWRAFGCSKGVAA